VRAGVDWEERLLLAEATTTEGRKFFDGEERDEVGGLGRLRRGRVSPCLIQV